MMLEVFGNALLISSSLSFVWLWLWLREDRLHPEPRSRVALAFVGGMIVVGVALLLETVIEPLTGTGTYKTTVVWSFIEEVVKWLAIWLTAYRTQILDEPIDALMYAIIVALGFAAFENALFIIDSLSHGTVYSTTRIAILRFIGATLLHVAATGTLGAFIGFAWVNGRTARRIATLVGLLLATCIHSLFNIWIIHYSQNNVLSVLAAFGMVWGTIGILMFASARLKTITLTSPHS